MDTGLGQPVCPTSRTCCHGNQKSHRECFPSRWSGAMSQQRTERRGIHVDQSDLLCKKGCGYYGNTAWQGLCSKCWREEYQRVRQKQIQDDWALAEKLQREEEAAYACSQGQGAPPQAPAPQPPPGHASLGPFSKFEEKKTNEKTRKVTTVKKFFSPSSRTTSKKGSAHSEAFPVRLFQFQRYLEKHSVELFCCAAAFIEKLDAQSLNLSPEEFERYMSGQASPRYGSSDGEWPPSGPAAAAASAANPVLVQLDHNLELLTSLSGRQDALLDAARSLQQELLSWPRSVQREVTDILEKYPLEVAASSVSAIDANNMDNSNLPSPLKPQVFTG
ncbi:unnamed protein product [Menidia menidia]|uniref:(Atlantic silverside) hypothetical protein n=1 Tax=Menidia menidia TaxID=238744 RepID=A0A8S4AQG2_9TELE|nr:unnamed protein product [Menidia menidia]